MTLLRPTQHAARKSKINIRISDEVIVYLIGTENSYNSYA